MTDDSGLAATIGARSGEADHDEGAAPAEAGDAPNPGEAASASRRACSFAWSKEVLSTVPPVPFCVEYLVGGHLVDQDKQRVNRHGRQSSE